MRNEPNENYRNYASRINPPIRASATSIPAQSYHPPIAALMTTYEQCDIVVDTQNIPCKTPMQSSTRTVNAQTDASQSSATLPLVAGPVAIQRHTVQGAVASRLLRPQGQREGVLVGIFLFTNH
jgi:hypothetical protein